MADALEDPADILQDALEFLGGRKVIEDEIIKYGDLQLTVAPKANTLLADHLFSPGLFLAERIERGLISAHRLAVIELGAGCALPSLLLSTLTSPPFDYHPGILGNLVRNVDRNKNLVVPGCSVKYCGYNWGTDPASLLALTPLGAGYDLIILSDLLHFHSSHPALVSSVGALLAHTPDARVHVAAGSYTKPEICENFLLLATEAGFVFREVPHTDGEERWLGKQVVSDLDSADLATRKSACRYWIGRRV
ncbi:hypothetical protein C8J57DRAFT_1322580 [Mycena rebaudengoi]|nr:hypothetical protein C8J57DRAFT_1322580 [Mycena rebaudengoi]